MDHSTQEGISRAYDQGGEMSKVIENNIYGQNKEVNLTGELMEKVSDFILNAGRGNLAPLVGNHISIFIDAFYQDLIEELKKKAADKKAHATLLNQIQDRIIEIQKQIDALQGKIDVLEEEKSENTSQIDKNKERMEQLKSEGKDDSPEYLALVAANEALNARNKDIDKTIDDYKDKQEGLQNELDGLTEMKASGNTVAYQENLDSKGSDVFLSADDVNNAKLIPDVSEKFVGRRVQAKAEHEIAASTEVKKSVAIGFLGEDFLEPSSPKSMIVAEFTQSANGQIPPSSPTQTQEISNPGSNGPSNGMIG